MQYVLGLLAALSAVEANPLPQGITAAISPTAAAPAGCSADYSGTFGIAIVTPGMNCGVAPTQSSDGQPEVPTATPATEYTDGQPEQPTAPVATEYSDGQPEAPTATVATEYSDGQPEAPTAPTATVATEYTDGQPQWPTMITSMTWPTAMVATEYTDGQPEWPMPTVPVATEYSDGQPEAPTATAPVATEYADGQPEAPTATAPVATEYSDGQPEAPTATVATEYSDGQPEAPTATLATQSADGQPETTATPVSSCADMQACQSNDTLAITLAGGVLKDSYGRTGYIASNTQFQFDNPPQDGAIYTSGFSVCSNGSLALGGSSTFYECLSGSFYNLYTTSWAAQCKPVAIQAVELVSC